MAKIFNVLFKIILSLLTLSACSRSSDNSGPVESFIILHPVSELPQQGDDLNGDMRPTLIGGRMAEPKDWPASMYADLGGARCTATLIGEKVLLIAAHCVNNGGTAKFNAAGQNYTAVCTHSKDYATNPTADYNACEIDRAVTNIPFELINTNPDLIKVGEEILLTGYGCTQPGGKGGNDGTYRIGESRVSQLPSASSNDIVTVGPAALCYGDSGGPAFKLIGNKRFQLSINSRGDIRTTSYLSSLATTQGKRFLTSWTEKTGLKICGMHADAVGCRSEGGPGTPPPPPPLSVCKEAYDKLGKCLFSTGKLMIAPASCYQVAGLMFSCLEEKYK